MKDDTKNAFDVYLMELMLLGLGRMHEHDVSAERGGGLKGRLGLVGVAELRRNIKIRTMGYSGIQFPNDFRRN